MTADRRASENREDPFPVPVRIYTVVMLLRSPPLRCWQMDEALQEQGRIPRRQVCPEMGPSLTYVCANHIIISRLTAALLSGLLKVLGAVKKLGKSAGKDGWHH